VGNLLGNRLAQTSTKPTPTDNPTAAGVYVHAPDTCPICAPAVSRRMRSLAAAIRSAPGGHLVSQKRERAGEGCGGAPRYLQQRYLEEGSRRPGGDGREGAGEGGKEEEEEEEEAAAAAAAAAGGGAGGGAAAPQSLESRRHLLPPTPPPAYRPKGCATAPVTRLQRGVLRTNCVDCLDRTNVAQFAFGLSVGFPMKGAWVTEGTVAVA
jgi:hypothetical protein